MRDDEQPPARIGRRRALALLGGVGVVAVGAACSDGSSPDAAGGTTSTTAAPTAGSTPAGSVASEVACVLTPEQTEGPYYLDINDVRSDIAEDREGAPLTLAITVVDADGCTPIRDAAVDVWHCDAEGVYSGFGGGNLSKSAQAPLPGGPPSGGGPATPTNDETFLRGTQVTDRTGVAEFESIYPGWYSGRAVHIHVKVHTGGALVHIGQLYFDEAVAAEVYAQGVYEARGEPDTPNEADGIYTDGGSSTLMTPTGNPDDGYTAAITLGVRPT